MKSDEVQSWHSWWNVSWKAIFSLHFYFRLILPLCILWFSSFSFFTISGLHNKHTERQHLRRASFLLEKKKEEEEEEEEEERCKFSMFSGKFGSLLGVPFKLSFKRWLENRQWYKAPRQERGNTSLCLRGHLRVYSYTCKRNRLYWTVGRYPT